jgi:hypothetical protein
LNKITEVKERIQDDEITRYKSVNICGIQNRPQTLEIRLHSGSVDAPKVLSTDLARALDEPPLGCPSRSVLEQGAFETPGRDPTPHG